MVENDSEEAIELLTILPEPVLGLTEEILVASLLLFCVAAENLGLIVVLTVGILRALEDWEVDPRFEAETAFDVDSLKLVLEIWVVLLLLFVTCNTLNPEVKIVLSLVEFTSSSDETE